ncbi:MlaD family protein [Gracilimonas sediminicola]|uniref:MlaD family protein n=1 Tax=Gracilimonas sediminicola TaxID=2952158 RepID=A0A9X2RGD1_9BACT|nr:MlaD family protein [Gracilimonas sediminicola]
MSNELKIGITVVVAIIVAFIGYRVMKDIPLFRTSTTIYTKFDQVYGLIPGNVVNVKGFKIGSVKQMELLVSDSTLVTMNIEEGYQIPKGSIAVLKSSGVLGGKFIEIQKADSTEMVPHQGSIEGVFEQGMMDTFAEEGEKLSTDISASIRGVEKLVTSLNETLDDENKENITGIIRNLQSSTGSLNQLIQSKQSDLDAMITSAKQTMQNMDDLSSENKEKLNSLITNLEATSAELETLSSGLNETNLTLNEVLTKINNGEGTLGKMVNDPSLYNNVDSLSFNLNRLIKNMNDEPGKYLKHMRLIEVF